MKLASVTPAVALLTILAAGFAEPAGAQQANTTRAPTLDAGSLRRQAAQLAELRSLLNDPDPNIRVVAIREIARTGDPLQRQLAIDIGLSSAEAAIQQVAIRELMVHVKQIVLALEPPEGKAPPNTLSSFALTVAEFNPETGALAGLNNYWSGQIQGASLAFVYSSNISANLFWNAEAGEYRGIVNFNSGRAEGDRKASWRPR